MKHIISIEIINSTFYNSQMKFNFSENLNCVMGSRGTGKSTLLHFIKACIDPNAEDDRITYSILKNNLGIGMIRLIVQDDNGKKYKIEKSLDDDPQAYDLPKSRFTDFDAIHELIDCDIYEAQKIEEIGKNSEDRLALIDKMIITDKLEVITELEDIQLNLDENAQLIKSENARLNNLQNSLKNYDTVEADLALLLDEKPDDINKDEEKEFENADKNEKIRTGEKRYVKAAQKKVSLYSDSLKELMDDVNEFKKSILDTKQFLNKEYLDQISNEVKVVLQDLETSVKSNMINISKSAKKIDAILLKLNEKHNVQQNEFTQLKQKFEKDKLYYNKRNSLTKKIDEKKVIENEITLLNGKRNKISKARKKLIEDLNNRKLSLFRLRKEKVDNLNSEFNGAIKITLTLGGITDEYEQALRNALKGSNMRYNVIIPSIVQNFSPDKFAEIVHSKNADVLKKIAGIDKERSNAIFNALHGTDEIYEIEKLYCPDLPEFLLKIDSKDNINIRSKDNYKKSDELSTGQRCTTVLPIVFAISNNPLIIDQPEDNLDNKYISDTIHQIIREQKKTRQLIFITHNPNIPVLSDSEQNYFLSYSDKKSQIDIFGDIDVVKNNILNLLEGGKAAFEKREKLYKF